MQILFLGTRGEINLSHPDHKNHSGILIDKKILLDLGEKRFLDYHPSIILITHLHPDHAYFIKKGSKFIIPTTIYGPEILSKVGPIINLHLSLQFEAYKITPVPVIHSLKVMSQGYLIEKGGKRIFYSGDIIEIRPQYLHHLHDLDAVITEASFIRKGGVIRRNEQGKKSGHAGVPDLIELFEGYTSRIIFTHFGTWFIKDVKAGKEKIRQLEKPGLSLEVAHDGRQFIV